jgi:hypothetical protein
MSHPYDCDANRTRHPEQRYHYMIQEAFMIVFKLVADRRMYLRSVAPPWRGPSPAIDMA